MTYAFTARKHIGPLSDGNSVDAPNITDTDLNTTDTIFARGLPGAADDDWFILDCGSSVPVGSVVLSNVTFSLANQGVSVWMTDNVAATPTGAGTTQLGASWLAGAGTSFATVTVSGAVITGRYVLILEQAATGQSMTIGAATVSPAPPPAVPTLTATPSLPGNVPSIILQGM